MPAAATAIPGVFPIVKRYEHPLNTRCSFSKPKCDCIKSLKLGDPAAGSGNFLTETYLCLRRMENEILTILYLDAQIGRNLHCLPAVICGTIVNICSRYLIVPV